MSRLKKSGFLDKLMFLVGLLLLWSLVRGFSEFKGAYRRVEEAKEVLDFEDIKNQQLKEKLEEVQKDDYIEKVVRNELNMQKEGEVVVVLSDDPTKVDVFGQENKLEIEENKQNWKKWLDLIR
jgi:cell division protein FtsB